MQGKCHTTILNEDGSPSKFECGVTFQDTSGKSFAARGVFDMNTGTAKYAILGGTGEYMGAFGEATVTYEPAKDPILGETADLYRYEVCLYTPALKAQQ